MVGKKARAVVAAAGTLVEPGEAIPHFEVVHAFLACHRGWHGSVRRLNAVVLFHSIAKVVPNPPSKDSKSYVSSCNRVIAIRDSI